MFAAKCLVLSLFILGSNSSPSGAPAGSCASMTPSPTYHASTQQTTSCPYTIQTSPSTFTCGSSVSVTLDRENSTTTPGFKGFLCQARTAVDDYTTVVGSLTSTDTTAASRNKCAVNASITHADKTIKNSFTFDWTNDGTSATTSNVFIVCTFVQTKTIYWVKLASQMLTYSGTATTC